MKKEHNEDPESKPWTPWNSDLPFGSVSPNIKREAVTNDRRLQDLATYEVTKGLTVSLEHPQATLPLFAEYKRLVRQGSFTVDQLEERVLDRYAIVSHKMENPLADIEFLDEEPETNYGFVDDLSQSKEEG
jgi:hypothetical protein